MIGPAAAKMGLRPAAHDDELAVLGPRLTAGDRRVDPADAGFARHIGQLPRNKRGNGGVIDEDGPLGHARQRPILAQHDRPQIVVIADTGHDEFRALGRLARRRGMGATMLGRPFLRLCGRPVVDRDLVAGRLEVPRHRVAHHAQTQKRQFRHHTLRRLTGPRK